MQHAIVFLLLALLFRKSRICAYFRVNVQIQKKHTLLPYFMSVGCTLSVIRAAALFVKKTQADIIQEHPMVPFGE